MSFFSKQKRVSVGTIILLIISALVIVFVAVVAFLSPTADPATLPSKVFVVVAGLLSGLLVMLGQFMIELKNDVDLSRFRESGVKRVLITRDDEIFYGDLVAKAQVKIDVLGVTASRFVNDFANDAHHEPRKYALLTALRRGVQVRILVAARRVLNTDEQRSHDQAAAAFVRLREKFPDSFQFRYFDHAPAHSVVVVDQNCLIGPVFPGLDSKATPAVQSESFGPFALPYQRYFETEWTVLG